MGFRLRIRRPRLARFFWHIRNGTLRRYGWTWRGIWRLTAEPKGGEE